MVSATNILVLVAIVVTIALLISVLYIKPAIQNSRKRRKQAKKVSVSDRGSTTVSVRALEQLSSAFDEDETVIIRATRLSKVSFLPWTIFAGLIALVLLIVSAYMALHLGTRDYSWQGRDFSGKENISHLSVPWAVLALIPFLAALLSAFSAWNNWLRWRAYTLIITNKAVRVDFQASSWLWWLWNDEKHDPQPLIRIVRVEFANRYWGEVWHYGDVDVVVLMQEGGDAPTNHRYVPNHADFAADVSELLSEIRQSEDEEAQSHIDLARQTAENTAGMHRELKRLNRTDAGDQPTEKWPLPES